MTDDSDPEVHTATPAVWGPALKEAGWSFLTAGVFVSLCYTIFFRSIHPEFVPFMDRNATKHIAPGNNLIPVSIGKYHAEGSNATIEDINDDEAILALPKTFQAEDYPFIKVNLEGFTRYSKFKLLWRRESDISVTHALPMTRNRDGTIQIAMAYGYENYRGRIADIALLFYDGPAIGFERNNGEKIKIHSIEFKPFSVATLAQQIFDDWRTPPYWGGPANNHVASSHYHRVISLSSAVFFLALAGIVVAAVARIAKARSHEPSYYAVVLCLCMYSAVLLDTNRWLWRVSQLIDTYERYQGRPLSEKIVNNPQRCARDPESCRVDLLPHY